MILLVFEGEKGEPRVMATLQYLYFSGSANQVLCYYGTDTHTLWKEVKEYEADGYEADVFTIVKQRMQSRGDHSLDLYNSYQIESIYLFFDYDPQNKTIPPERLNQEIQEMVLQFDDPMDKGKIYISYPMAESLFCINSVPDSSFISTDVAIEDCRCFKGWCMAQYELSRKPGLLIYKTDKTGRKITETNPASRKQELIDKWNSIVLMSIEKANMICTGQNGLPDNVDIVSQMEIFIHERDDYVLPSSKVSILSAFPMFLYEYFHGNGIF